MPIQFRKIEPGNYEVINGKSRGWLYRDYVRSTGAWAVRYVGHTPGHYHWVWDVENSPEMRWGMYTFDSFKQAKKQIPMMIEKGEY